MSPHAFVPSLQRSQRTIFIRTRRPLWQRVLPAAACVLVTGLLVCAVLVVIARMHTTEAQLRAAHQAGMAAGMHTCPER